MATSSSVGETDPWACWSSMPKASIRLKSGFKLRLIFYISQSFSSFIISCRHYSIKARLGPCLNLNYFFFVCGVSAVLSTPFPRKDELRVRRWPPVVGAFLYSVTMLRFLEGIDSKVEVFFLGSRCLLMGDRLIVEFLPKSSLTLRLIVEGGSMSNLYWTGNEFFLFFNFR